MEKKRKKRKRKKSSGRDEDSGLCALPAMPLHAALYGAIYSLHRLGDTSALLRTDRTNVLILLGLVILPKALLILQ